MKKLRTRVASMTVITWQEMNPDCLLMSGLDAGLLEGGLALWATPETGYYLLPGAAICTLLSCHGAAHLVRVSHVPVLMCFLMWSIAGDIKDLSSIPESERSPGGEHGNPLQYFCLENSHGQRSLVGYSSWGCKGLDITKHRASKRVWFSPELAHCSNSVSCSNKLCCLFILPHVWKFFSNPHTDHDSHWKGFQYGYL